MDKQRILTPILLAAFFAVGATACERGGGGTSSSPSGTAPQRSPDTGAGAQTPSSPPSQPGSSPSQPGGSTGSGGTGTQQ